ncbi:MAG: PEP-CTERM sorting domain-containing protein, partial [Pirellulales bacterium]
VGGEAERAASAGGGRWATLWQTDAGNTPVDLDAWLDANNPTLGAYWMLSAAYGINDNGLITGTGLYDDGPGGLSDGTRAFILDAGTLVGVPEPATLALLVLGLPFLVWRKSRQLRTDRRRFALAAATRAITFARSDP